MPKHIYYSPFGGEVYAVLEEADPDWEAEAKSRGLPVKHATVADAKVKRPKDEKGHLIIAGAKFNGTEVV